MTLRGSAWTIVLTAILTTFAPANAEGAKDPTTAGLLGGLVGFGAGYYYTHETTKGIGFSVLDAGLIGGIAATDEDGLQWGLGAGLLASHIWQGLDGANAARRDNRRHRLPFGLDLSATGLGTWDSSRLHDLFAAGGPSRDLAWSFQALATSQPALSFGVGWSDSSVGVRYQTSF